MPHNLFLLHISESPSLSDSAETSNISPGFGCESRSFTSLFQLLLWSSVNSVTPTIVTLQWVRFVPTTHFNNSSGHSTHWTKNTAGNAVSVGSQTKEFVWWIIKLPQAKEPSYWEKYWRAHKTNDAIPSNTAESDYQTLMKYKYFYTDCLERELIAQNPLRYVWHESNKIALLGLPLTLAYKNYDSIFSFLSSWNSWKLQSRVRRAVAYGYKHACRMQSSFIKRNNQTQSNF